MASDSKSPHVQAGGAEESMSSNIRNAANAPEVDHSAYAPQIDYGSAPEPVRQDAPQILSYQEQPRSVVAGKQNVNGYFVVPRKRVLWCLIALIMAIAIALGVGLGVSLTRAKSTNSSPVNTPTPGSSPIGGGNSTGNSTSGPGGVLANSIANDTSLASVETSNGSRHMFYQDGNGSVQHAVYTSSQSSWSIQLGEMGLNDVRNKSPMAAVRCNLRQVLDSRPLVIFRIPSMDGTRNDIDLLVLTQRPTAGASLIYATSNVTQASWTWKDITSELNSSNSTKNYSFNTPFAVAGNVSNAFLTSFLSSSVSYPWVGVFANEIGTSFGLSYNTLVPADSSSLPAPILSTSYDLALAAIHGQLSIMYVSNNQLATTGETNLNVGAVKNNTASTFPFARLSGYLSGGGLYYLYHQLDGRTVAEDVFDPERGWSSGNVTAPG
ncbi:MAG: hypothetical protein LQ340_005104 [Diploschistes diacapsis]|nr:MAG: hypothetical protein LQ340_005104 [Diploschistes diacapsis]